MPRWRTLAAILAFALVLSACPSGHRRTQAGCTAGEGSVVFSARYSHQRPHAGLFAIDSNGRILHRLTRTTQDELFPDWSPDGRRILFETRRTLDRGWTIFTARSDGSHSRP